jgi:hypothetical protein
LLGPPFTPGDASADKPNPWKPTKLTGLAIGENSALAVPVPILIAIFIAFLVSTDADSRASSNEWRLSGAHSAIQGNNSSSV